MGLARARFATGWVDQEQRWEAKAESPAQRSSRDFFVAVEAYLSDSCALGARKLKAELGRDSKKPQASVDDKLEIIDTFDGGVTLWWYADTEFPKANVISYSPGDEKRRFYRVVFHKKFRKPVLEMYLPQVMEKGRAVIARNRKRRLFTNYPSRDGRTCWSHVPFQHPATFETLAMECTLKQAIIDDLDAFMKGKDYYAKVGKAWKRGYLLHGPRGTGKSTMIAAMANFLEYDVYDLELTAVKNNTELRKLFVETTGKSIIVIEDIDRSVDLTGERRDKKAHKKSGGESDNMTLLPKEVEKDDDCPKLTLSGLLNFIDGLWSACGGERIIIFTTNNKDQLDPALIRPGRMDMQIEMSYCGSEAFKVLASNYLMDITDHQLFELFSEIEKLLGDVKMSPAAVAEHLMVTDKRDAEACLKGLVVALKKAKEQVAMIHGETGAVEAK
ncbi:AAA-ATPase ASD, mitochondrial [Dichanthelium oligosanthes]|uniref:AAA-ATPase ASD, mitochondrial n=1 Tax=Dichanthelium oligosanthes TaxID=888268 RepID=A0A1E5V7D2_9POAL|nr:AAA-ATPase ASD, mitochondrial [Dichanthelium oligosanthes]